MPGFGNPPGSQLSDGVNSNDVPFLPYFPYVAPPHNPVNNDHCARTGDSHHGRGGDDGDDQGDDESRAPTIGLQSTSGARIALSGANPGSQHVLEYSVPATARVGLKIYAANGRLVRTLVDQDAAPGSFRAVWDGRDDSGATLAKGVYFARYTTNGGNSDNKKLILE